MSGHHRFGMNKHRDAYKIFADALDQHPEWETFLDDMGAGTAPMEYNAMVEAVTRKVAKDDPFALGSTSLRSRDSWGHPDLEWKKREVWCCLTGVTHTRTGVYRCFTGVVGARTGV